MRKRKKVKQRRQYWRLNHNIHAPSVRVIDEKGKMLGEMSVSEALGKAKAADLDLVEIAPKAKPPVVKIVDFGKFKYAHEKKERKQAKGVKKTDLKEVRLSPFIGEADYKTRFDRISEFLDEGHKIRAVVKFKGRQMGSKKFGYNLLKRIIDDIGEGINIDMEPKFIGRHLAMVISPSSKVAKKPENQVRVKNQNDKSKTPARIARQSVAGGKNK